MENLLLEAVGNKAELIVFPELATTGYSFMSLEDAQPYAETLDRSGYTFKKFSDLAKKHNIAIVWGMMGLADNGTLTNSQVLVTPTLSTYYTKVNPWGNDYLWSTPGTWSPPVTTFRNKKIGLLICRDVRDKSADIDTFYEKGDADIVAFSANFGDGAFPATAWMDFVKNNKVWMIVSNRFGQEACNNFGEGGVCVITPEMKVYCEGLRWNSPCIVYADIP